MEVIKQSITIMTEIIEPTVKQEKSNKDKLIDLDLELARAKESVKKTESKIKNATAEIGRLSDLILDEKATDNQNTLWKKKKEYRATLEESKKVKDKIVNSLITEITKMSEVINKDTKVIAADEQEAILKLSVADVTKLILHLFKVTNTQNLKELTEDVTKKFTSFQ
ncbi:Unknown protein sequence [Pseudomonas syringae pv. aptata]|nr:hypothetical protein [Pseudomonas syringae]KPY97886.1 Unknown protein sequence [Pseudomonas syringae pv. aptata]